MKDDRGCYYYPNPQFKTTRMYVREHNGQIEFRIWSSEAPEIWEKHEWIPLDVILKAAEQYPGQADPTKLYDENVARAVLKESAKD